MKGEILPLFQGWLLVCEEEGLLGGTFLPWMGVSFDPNCVQGMQWDDP